MFLCAKQMQNKTTDTVCELLSSLFICFCVGVSVRDRRAAVHTDGQMSGAEEQQMPEVTPPAAFHSTAGFEHKGRGGPKH